MSIDQEIQKVTSVIVERYRPQSVILFGSAAWADKTKAQDIDLCIIKETPKRRLERGAEVRSLFSVEDYPDIAMDILVYTPEEFRRRLALEDPFFMKIDRQGVRLYERG